MALLNPVYGLILPFLFLFTIPIAIIASITTTLAFSILAFRVVLIYIELAFAVIPHYLLGTVNNPKSLDRNTALPNSSALPSKRRKRRSNSSSSSLSAAGSTTPIQGENSLGLSQSVGHIRDYEGVGGWRLDNPDNEDDGLWTRINSRLELPADHVRRHHRSLTSGSMPGDTRLNWNYNPEAMMNTSRMRTPPSSAAGVGEGYFPLMAAAPKISKKTAAISSAPSVSSGSSKGSSVLSLKQR